VQPLVVQTLAMLASNQPDQVIFGGFNWFESNYSEEKF
jgi:hypothetical protein